LNTSAKRTYGQYCALAMALDVIGERWTLLIVRELLVRPRRYAELLHELPGIGTNLLAERLRFMVEAGLVAMVNPADRRSGYELTERGESLREPVLALARWGLEVMTEQAHAGYISPGWALLGVQALLDDSRAPAKEDDYMFVVDEEIFTISVRAGHAVARDGAVAAPSMTITTDASTLIDIGARRLNPMAALIAGKLTVATDDPETILRCLHLMGLSDAASSMA